MEIIVISMVKAKHICIPYIRISLLISTIFLVICNIIQKNVSALVPDELANLLVSVNMNSPSFAGLHTVENLQNTSESYECINDYIKALNRNGTLFMTIGNQQEIMMNTGQQLVAMVEASPSVGDKWVSDFDNKSMILVTQSHKYSCSTYPPILPGTSGVDFFNFKAIKPGTSEILFRHFYRGVEDHNDYHVRVTVVS